MKKCRTMEACASYGAMVLTQLAYGGANILTKIALEKGLNQLVFVVYRHIIAMLLLGPFAYVIERLATLVMTSLLLMFVFLLLFLSYSFFPTLRVGNPYGPLSSDLDHMHAFLVDDWLPEDLRNSFPWCLFLQSRKHRPSLSFPVLTKIFLLASLGTTIHLNVYYAGLSYISPTVASALSNVIPSLTFVLAVILR